MTTFDIRIVSSYSGLVVFSALDVASGRRQDHVPKYIFGNLTVKRSTGIKQGSYTVFSSLLPGFVVLGGIVTADYPTS